ncbi:MAG: type II toxin-antitoxin system HicB family antitoxin [Oscillospiraceae bacterium]|nr:type II toxin-antitoxin system HicB family antitoxin [Oscillospiraceae bacterium]
MNDFISVSYCAVYQFEEDGINIGFPDLPGCLSCAFSEEQADYMAKDALSLWLNGMRYEELPKPTPADSFVPKPGEKAVAVTARIQVKDGCIVGIK